MQTDAFKNGRREQNGAVGTRNRLYSQLLYYAGGFCFAVAAEGVKSLEICGVCLYTRQLFKFIGE